MPLITSGIGYDATYPITPDFVIEPATSPVRYLASYIEIKVKTIVVIVRQNREVPEVLLPELVASMQFVGCVINNENPFKRNARDLRFQTIQPMLTRKFNIDPETTPNR